VNPFRRSVDAILDLLRQGITPEKIALSVAFGIAVGVIPVLGVTTALCTVLAIALRLNLVAIQAANWIVYPLQIALLIPFYRAGEFMFDAPRLNLMPADILALFKEGVAHAVARLWGTTWRAVAAWSLFSLALVPALYGVLTPILRRAWRRRSAVCGAAA
jgi:uncharacterized protein (DUF2062 family)